MLAPRDKCRRTATRGSWVDDPMASRSYHGGRGLMSLARRTALCRVMVEESKRGGCERVLLMAQSRGRPDQR